ncbi:hypothetical protein D3C75_1004150 [compost metagenome]
MKPVITTAKARKASSFMRSATAPETIDMAVATNTTWKKKSARLEKAGASSPPAATRSTACSSPIRKPRLGRMPPSGLEYMMW